MTRFVLLVLTLTPGAALAHEGAHLHPHGIEFGLGALVASFVVGGALGALAVARVKK
ncbi:MAG: hypothetical protein QNJ13_05330 [Paracoccaceae bacterium]|nr:hypothetical protein [Paracoccaceae bacterium]